MTARPSLCSVDELADLLSRGIERRKAELLVRSTAESLGMNPGRLELEDAQTLLDQISKSEGLIGITARLAKAQLRVIRLQVDLKQRTNA